MDDNKNVMEWYNNNAVKFNLIKFLQKREFCLLRPKFIENPRQMECIRDLRCHSVQHITGILRYKLKCAVLDRQYNLYYSMVTFRDGVPGSELVFPERDMSDWKDRCWKETTAYDMLIDIDADDHTEIEFAYKSATVIKNVFDRYFVPYELRFSGCGFHFIIPYDVLPQHYSFDPSSDDSIYQFCKDLAMKLKNTYSEMVDTTIYDHRRVCKLPYSVAIYETENYLCLPFLNDKEFIEFELSKYKMAEWDDALKLRDRGTHLFNPFGSLRALCNDLGLELNKDGKKNP